MAHIPIGTIVIWSGAIADIPDEWALCNGANGTPDLVERFVQGAGGALIPGDTGGSSTHDHTFTTNGHFHSLPISIDIQAGVPLGPATDVKTDTGTTNIRNHLPPFYALAYIMHIG